MEPGNTCPDPRLAGFAEASSDDERVQWLNTHLDSLGPEAVDWLAEQLWLISDGIRRREAYCWVLPHLDALWQNWSR